MNVCETKILAEITARGAMEKQQVGVELSCGDCQASTGLKSFMSTAGFCASALPVLQTSLCSCPCEQATARRTQEAHCFYQWYFLCPHISVMVS